MNAFLARLSDVQTFTDPTTGSGDVALFAEAMGQNGRPFVLHVEDPPNKTRPRHHHHADVVYFYTKGEHHIEGEGVYRAGDVRWTRAGHAYGPETTGPEGGAWWIVTYGDPTPVDHFDTTAAAAPTIGTPATIADPKGVIARAPATIDTRAAVDLIQTDGAVILESFLAQDVLAALDRGIDDWLHAHPGAGAPKSGSPGYDVFLGQRTVRLHGLLAKLPSAECYLANPHLLALARAVIGPRASSILLNAGELIQIGPGEPAQLLHRDTDSWPDLPQNPHPVLINAILALDDFTLENGATYVAPGSHIWAPHRRPAADELARATMRRGDIIFFRGDIIHGGGENVSGRRRRALSASYCAGWLRPVENSLLNVSRDVARRASPAMQALLGYAAHDATARLGGVVGLFENGPPQAALETP